MKILFLSFIYLLFMGNVHGQVIISDNFTKIIDGIARPYWGYDEAMENLNLTPKKNPNTISAGDFINGMSRLAFQGRDYPIVDLTIPTVASSFNLSLHSSIRLIDLRPDQQKTGFVPISLKFKQQGFKTIGLTVQNSPLNWIKNWLETSPFTFDTASPRKLVLVLRDCWFSQDAFVPRHSAKNSFVTTLNYHLEFFTQIGNEYYPQEKIKGTFSAPFKEGNAYHHLLDSLQHLIEKKGIDKMDEQLLTKRKVQAQEFITYVNEIKSKKIFALNPSIGVYESFEQFMDHSPITQSAIVIKTYNMSEVIPTYALQLLPVVNGIEKSSFGIWGYYDGTNLYYNTGNGLFIRLLKDRENGYFFQDLNLLSKDNIKSSLFSGVKFGQSDYSIIKEYARITPLTYKLNLSDGRLY